MNQNFLDHLDHLESEAIHIFREVAGEFERPVILFSGGKDSVVMLHLALKPAPVSARSSTQRMELSSSTIQAIPRCINTSTSE